MTIADKLEALGFGRPGTDIDAKVSAALTDLESTRLQLKRCAERADNLRELLATSAPYLVNDEPCWCAPDDFGGAHEPNCAERRAALTDESKEGAP